MVNKVTHGMLLKSGTVICQRKTCPNQVDCPSSERVSKDGCCTTCASDLLKNCTAANGNVLLVSCVSLSLKGSVLRQSNAFTQLKRGGFFSMFKCSLNFSTGTRGRKKVSRA